MILLLITGALIGLNWMLLFEAYNYTSVSVATLCYYMQPTIVILLSPLVFSEKLTGKRMICALAAVIGMVLVSGVIGGSAGQGGDLKGIACGLGAAALYATVVILNKKMEFLLLTVFLKLHPTPHSSTQHSLIFFGFKLCNLYCRLCNLSCRLCNVRCKLCNRKLLQG